MTKPTIYLSNWSSHARHGPGRKLSIMARPRAWEHGAGWVPDFTPEGSIETAMLAAVAERRIGVEAGPAMVAYRHAFRERLRYLDACGLFPVTVRLGRRPPPSGVVEVRDTLADGDTLLCACSVEHARAGWCHRTWVAEALRDAGDWRVVLDGRVVP